MTRTFIIILWLFGGCDSSTSKKSQLAIDIGTILLSGKYDVQILEHGDSNKTKKAQKSQVIVTNNAGLIEFKGIGSFNSLDSISISLNDSVLYRQFSIHRFLDTLSIPSDRNGFNQDYFGYAFGMDNSRGIASIPEFRHLFDKETFSGSQHLFIVGRTRQNNSVIIKRVEKVILAGKILLDVNISFLLTPNSFSQQ
jgi:hypothetical protein